MVVLGGILGALIGLAIVVLPAEWIAPDALSDTTETVISVLVAATGAFAGSHLTRRLLSR